MLTCTGLALVLGNGCGGSSDASGGSPVTVQTGSLSKAEFIKRADAICEASRKQYVAEYKNFTEKNEKAFTSNRAAIIKRLADEVMVPNYEKRIEEIAALGAPAADSAEVAAYVRAVEGALRRVRREPVKVSESLNTVFAPIAIAAQRYGIQSCIG
jgi:hypothetical protein